MYNCPICNIKLISNVFIRNYALNATNFICSNDHYNSVIYENYDSGGINAREVWVLNYFLIDFRLWGHEQQQQNECIIYNKPGFVKSFSSMISLDLPDSFIISRFNFRITPTQNIDELKAILLFT